MEKRALIFWRAGEVAGRFSGEIAGTPKKKSLTKI